MAKSLQPVAETVSIQAGDCVLVPSRPIRDRKALDIRDYWPGVVCTPKMLPEKVARSRPRTIAPLIQPIWLIGRSEFLWVSRSNISSLNDIQLAKYQETSVESEFATCFVLAQESDGDLEYWRNTILEHKKKVDKRDITMTRSIGMKRLQETDDGEHFRSGSQSTGLDGSDDSHIEDSDYEGFVRKKMRSQTMKPASRKRKDESRSLIAPSPPPFMNGPLPSPPASLSHPSATPAASSQPGFIKPEPNDNDNDDSETSPSDPIEIFVGRTNTKFQCSRHNLTQSRILTSLITTRTDNDQQHPFIMDPTLSTIDPKHFTSVLEFLNAHEYEPLLISHSHPHADGSASVGFSLDDSTAPINYSNELVRSAQLFNLAKQLQLPAFARLVFRKVVQGHHRYEGGAFLDFADTVLRYEEADFEEDREGESLGEGMGTGMKGVLEQWVIKFLAENMHGFCAQGSADSGAFWDVMRIKGVELRVVERRAQLCRLYPGGRIKIEDD